MNTEKEKEKSNHRFSQIYTDKKEEGEETMTDERKLWMAAIGVFVLIAVFAAVGDAYGEEGYAVWEPFSVSWTASPEPDVRGYEIYRSEGDDGAPEKVHTGLITATIFAESELPPWGAKWYYQLRAVDYCGNESALSIKSLPVIHDFVSETGESNPGTPSGIGLSGGRTVEIAETRTLTIKETTPQ